MKQPDMAPGHLRTVRWPARRPRRHPISPRASSAPGADWGTEQQERDDGQHRREHARLGFTVADSDAAERDFWDAQVQAAAEHWTDHEAEEADAKHAAIMKELATIKRMLPPLVHSEPTVPGA